jgi:predicted CXXCH cytochrome family protein
MTRNWTLLLTSVLVVAFLAGCEARTRYRVLSFFFDGVPDPDKVAALAAAAGKDAGEKKARPIYRSHGPYEAKMCEACHQRGTNTLSLPMEELCFKCHTLDIRKKYLHGPVAVGGCRVCHEPHGSGRLFLLVSEPQKFCFHCHDEKMVSGNEAHKGVDAPCTTCHDAHSSENRFLLK